MRSILFLLCLAMLGRPALSDPKVVLLPLDDRPCNLLFVEQLGRIAGARVVSPPRPWLRPAQPERLAGWLRSQPADLKLVSLEMLCYGGLVGSRRADVPIALARERLESLRALTGRVDLVATLPRLSLLTSEAQASYERRLAAWAASGSTEPPADVPAEILAEYRFVRQRNLELLGFALDLLEDRTVHRLVVGLDDSAPRGPHLAEAAWLEGEVRRRRLQERFSLLSGADELSMSMLTGWLADRAGLHPSVEVIYSDPEAADRIPPLETMPLARMVDDHLKLAGARLASPGDVVLLVLVPGEEGIVAQVERLLSLLAAGRRVAVADLSRVNQMDPGLATALIDRVPVHRLDALAGWNTAANAFGTAVAQLVAHRLAARQQGWSLERTLESEKTHQAFLMARLVDDYAYQAVVRPRHEAGEATALLIRLHLLDWARELFDRRWRGRVVELEALGRQARIDSAQFEVALPWRRVFEVELRVDLRLTPVPR